MGLRFFEAYSKTIAKPPVDEWRELMQETINESWDNTSTVETVLGQVSLGSKDYKEESVQLNSVIDPKTGKSFGDEYRKIIYRVLNDNLITKNLDKTSRFLGKYYQIGDFIWLTINTNTVVGADASAILQRCNNSLKWYDKKGIYHEWPCVFERSLSSTGLNNGNEGVTEISSDTLIKVQLNKETNSIEYNQRFLFNGHAFQIKQINNHVSDSYMELYLFETQIQSNDNKVDDIANSKDNVTTTSTENIILPKTNQITQNSSQNYSIYKYDNGLETADTFEISAQGPAEGVNYKLNILDGNNFVIENLLKSNIPLEITCVNKNTAEVITKSILLIGEW